MQKDSTIQPSAADMTTTAMRVIARLPQQFREQLRDVVVKIEDFADDEQLEAVGLNNRWQLSGLYQGVPLPEKSVWAATDMPPVISLFRKPLLREWQETGVEWEALIRHVVIHEAGHHFGFSDDEMHALEDEAG